MPAYALIGYPISQSLAPTFQNAVFDLEGSTDRYELWSTSRMNERVLSWIRSEECKGAAVTMPLKAAIIPHLDGITPESRLTGAVNTIVKVPSSTPPHSLHLIGTNTDFLGIVISLRAALQAQYPNHLTTTRTFAKGTLSAAVIGGGATTRSAVLALHRLGLGPILLVNRDEDEVRVTMEWFARTELPAEGLKLVHVRTPREVEAVYASGEVPPLGFVIGAVPAILPQTPGERLAYSTATHLFTLPRPSTPQFPDANSPHLPIPPIPIFMDMAYYPRPTPLTQIATAMGWQTVDGIQSMIEQGFAQQRMWRAGLATVEAGIKEGVLQRATEEVVRERMARVPDVRTEGVEVDRADEA